MLYVNAGNVTNYSLTSTSYADLNIVQLTIYCNFKPLKSTLYFYYNRLILWKIWNLNAPYSSVDSY